MEIKTVGVIGLGRMGSAVVERLLHANYHVAVFDIDEQLRNSAARQGVTVVTTLESLAHEADIIWMMIPAGDPVDEVLMALQPNIRPGTIIIDAGNSHFADSVRRHDKLLEHDIFYLDCGTSGGIHGRQHGFSLMIGGDQKKFELVEPVFKALAVSNGYAYLGRSGAGHYVKMVHNGIEYALLQSYAEGLHLLHDGRYKELDLEKVTRVWQHGSVIRSFIVDLAHNVYKSDQDFKKISGKVGGGSTGRWAVVEAHNENIPVRLLEEALLIRDESQLNGGNYATKLVALLRHEFGGHGYETEQ